MSDAPPIVDTPSARNRGTSKAMHAEWVEVQGAISNPPKDKLAKVKTKTGPDYSYTYASLDGILNYVRPFLHRYGFGISQDVVSSELSPLVGVRTIVHHISGETMEFGPLYLPAGIDPQSAGSAISYARRYALCAALNIAAEEDDDGGRASGGRAASPVPVARDNVTPAGTDTSDAPVASTPQGAPTRVCPPHSTFSPLHADGHVLATGYLRCSDCGSYSDGEGNFK
jgi:hypothetical protein